MKINFIDKSKKRLLGLSFIILILSTLYPIHGSLPLNIFRKKVAKKSYLNKKTIIAGSSAAAILILICLLYFKEGRIEDRIVKRFCKNGNIFALKSLFFLNKKRYINKVLKTKTFFYGYTLLQTACSYSNYKMVEYLVENGADVDKKGHYETPLSIACSRGAETKIIRYLVENGANINVREKANETPLHFACKQNNVDTVKYLVENDANINVTNYKNETPLHFACKYNNVDTVKYLVESGAEINAINEEENTPLNLADRYRNDAIIKYLSSKSGKQIYIKKKKKRQRQAPLWTTLGSDPCPIM